MVCNDFSINGITTVVKNLAEYVKSNEIKIEIACGEPFNNEYLDELNAKNIILHQLPNRKKNSLKFYKALSLIIKRGNYDIVHVHGNSSTMAIELQIAKRNNVKIRIAHCHNSKCGSYLRHKILLPIFRASYTNAIACSDLAGDWIFGKNSFYVLNNGFVTSRFKFDYDKRVYYRSALNIKNQFVIGHVGIFNAQKNQKFIVDVFNDLVTVNNNLILLLVGIGPDFEDIKQYASQLICYDKIKFYGTSDDIPGLLSAMDSFIFPSLHEGLGLAAVEAQISGLPCFVSTNVPLDVIVGPRINFLPLQDRSYWVDMLSLVIKDYSAENEHEERQNFYSLNIKKINNFDILKCANKLEEFYKACVISINNR